MAPIHSITTAEVGETPESLQALRNKNAALQQQLNYLNEELTQKQEKYNQNNVCAIEVCCVDLNDVNDKEPMLSNENVFVGMCPLKEVQPLSRDDVKAVLDDAVSRQSLGLTRTGAQNGEYPLKHTHDVAKVTVLQQNWILLFLMVTATFSGRHLFKLHTLENLHVFYRLSAVDFLRDCMSCFIGKGLRCLCKQGTHCTIVVTLFYMFVYWAIPVPLFAEPQSFKCVAVQKVGLPIMFHGQFPVPTPP